MKEAMVEALREYKHEFRGTEDLEALAERFADCKVVMLGEASHGTHEYYTWRARLTRILMEKHGFDFMAVEGDWPACYHVNRHVKNYEDAGADIYEVLQQFNRWPSWMWANWEINEFATWLRDYNKGHSVEHRKGFYGLDVYSLWESLDAIVEYLEREDPAALATARKAMRCFEPHRDHDGQRYAYSTYLVPEGCQREVVTMLQEIRNKITHYNTDREHVFSTEQNAYIARNAEEYYRMMMRGGGSTWNLRDRHMMETLNRLFTFHGENSKAIVWAHNTHIGDASFTDMTDDGLFNIGELAREEFGREEVALIGFGSYSGTVMAGKDWGARAETMELPRGRAGSWEEICHKAGENFYILSEALVNIPEFQNRIPHRAVGVVYHPSREKYGNYVPTVIPERYDAFVFFNRTRALHAIPVGKMQEREVPDTYPFGV